MDFDLVVLVGCGCVLCMFVIVNLIVMVMKE